MDDYIAKPVKIIDLKNALERAGSKPLVSTMEETRRETEAIDRATLEALRDLQSEGEPDILIELIEMFLQDTPLRLAALGEAINRAAACDIASTAHAMKGSSANLGAMRMSELCLKLETLGRADRVEGADCLLAQLEAEFLRVREALAVEASAI
jgi:HPt (histidine-containing phosphotransfer) domain-containing protein